MNYTVSDNYLWDEDCILFDSWVEWKIVWISAWIHWNEHAWVEALEYFKNKLINWEISLTKWKILLILKWNKEALEQKRRFIKHDLNRCIYNYDGKYNENDYEI
jgi:succinylglutamate desuccinylase